MLFKAALCLLNLGLALAAPVSAPEPVSAVANVARAVGRTSAPSGALVVGSTGKYSTIQKAVNALSTSSTTAQSIFIQAGTYNEQVYIPSLKSALTIYGYTTDTSSYKNNVVTITHGIGLDSVANDDLTATLRVWTQNFKLYNVNVKNTRGSGSQALALSAYVGNQGYYGCKFIGFQDTILAQSGTQLYAGSYIEGATDFIFGQHGRAWFSKVDIRVLAASVGYITASGRASSTDTSYYVIDKSTVAAKDGVTVAAGAYYLGRPWGAYARVAFQETSLSAVINSKGWSVWSSSDARTSHVTFAEYGNTGTGAKGTRASFASTLSAKLAITDILGSSYAKAAYVDTTYI